MLVLAVLLSLAIIAIDGIVLVKLTLSEGFIKGMFGLLFIPYTFYWGWRHARSEDLKQTMLVWTTLLIGLVVLVALAVSFNR
jgi:phosphoglycerol transferase MdoB-like AlkP superfamily enzyme